MPAATPPSAHAIGARLLRCALAAGARALVAQREALNRINVFPVPDADTGNNLAATAASLLAGPLLLRQPHAGRLLRAVADEAIDNARGNSGAILAQFLHGVAERAEPLARLDAPQLAAALRHGASAARGAVAMPVEGTILSVIDGFCAAFADAAEGGAPIGAAFAQAVAAARIALAATPEQMPLLRQAGVVDAGAQGFVDALDGVLALRHAEGAGAAADLADGEPVAWHGDAPSMEVDPAARWCVECTLAGESLDAVAIRETLQGLGIGSLVVAGGGRHVRVHGHLGQPQALFDACAAFGDVGAMKADDMLRQARQALAPPGRVAVVTDSASDLPDAVAEELQLHVVPVRVRVDGRDFLDRVGLEPSTFHRLLATAAGMPGTSQPPPGDFRRLFELLAAQHRPVVYVGLSRAVSGTLQSAEHAAQRCGEGIRVFDTRNVAGGQALLAWRAGELAQAGADAGAILSELERLRPSTRMWALARDIRHVVRGGRMPAWVGRIVGWTGLAPVAGMSADGRLVLASMLFARRRAPEALARYVRRRLDPRQRWRVIVGHCDAAADAARLAAALRASGRVERLETVETGAALGVHAGPGALLVSVQPVGAA